MPNVYSLTEEKSILPPPPAYLRKQNGKFYNLLYVDFESFFYSLSAKQKWFSIKAVVIGPGAVFSEKKNAEFGVDTGEPGTSTNFEQTAGFLLKSF